MAVYKRTYRGYSGPLTAAWSRFLVIYRFSRRSVFRSRFQTGFFVLCFFYPLLALLAVYANAHADVFSMLAKSSGPLVKIDGRFFYLFLGVQTSLAFLLTAFIGPGLVSPDLANGALTLYLCRPLSRAEYVIGKLAVLFLNLSFITWIPALIVFVVQACLAGWSWFYANLFIAWAVFWSSLLWILTVSLISLALSAWVKWRIVAGALLLAVFFLGAGFARAINAVLDTTQGYLIDINQLHSIIQNSLLREMTTPPLSVLEASIALLIIAASFLWLLMRKIRPNEVVR
jgi:ABC-2 type transport system permease protein